MKTRSNPMFPRLRLLMMLFMLFSMAGSLSLTASAAPGQTDSSGRSAFQEPTAELCYTLDTNDPKLVLTQDELGVLAGDAYNYTEEQVAEVAAFCADLPSKVLSVDAGSEPEEGQQDESLETARIAPQSSHDDDPASAYFTIIKRFCAPEVDNSPNVNCTGRVDVSDDDVTVVFNVYEGVGEDGPLLGSLTFNPSDWTEGDGSQGLKSTEPIFEEGGVYTVCEVPVAGWDSVPRPGWQGGSNQSLYGDSCILVDTAVPNNNDLQFLNYPVEIPYYPFDVDKYFCTINADEAPEPEIGEPGENCVFATEGFTLSLWFDGADLGLTTEELLLGVALQAGTYQLYEGDTVLGNIVIPTQSHVDVLNYIPEPEGWVGVDKFLCDIDEVIGGIEMQAPVDGCVESTAEFDILDSEGVSLGIDSDMLLESGLTLPAGDYTLVELASGFEVSFTITAGSEILINVYNPEPEVPGMVNVEKLYCEDTEYTEPTVVGDDFDSDDCVTGTDSSIFDILNSEGVSVLGEGDDVFAGVELLAGVYTLVEYDGETVVLEYDFEVGEGETISIVVVNPVEEEPGLGKVIKYFCTDTDITVPVVGDDESDYDGCELATAEQLEGVNFWVIPFQTEPLLDIDDTALFGDGVVLPVGTHTLVEEFNGVIHELGDLTIVAGETTTFMVFNPIEMERTIDLDIYKAVCEDVDESDEEDPCVPSDVMDGKTLYFTVYALTGDVDDDELEVIDYVETSLVIDGNLGSAVVEDLPEADFYAVCEAVPAGIEAVYIYSIPGGEAFEDDELGSCIVIAGDDVTEDNLIEVLFLNDVEKDKPVEPEKPVTPEKPVIPAPQKPAAPVTKLPSTGSGAADTSPVTPWMLMASAAALAGTGAILRKERPAA